MRDVRSILVVCLLALVSSLPVFGGNDSTSAAPATSCRDGAPASVNCVPTKDDLKQAHRAYVHGVKLQEQKQLEKSFEEFDRAARLAPHDMAFISAREMTKAQLVFQHTERGDASLADAHREQATAEFRAALDLDPDDTYAQQRLAESLRDPAAPALGGMAGLMADSSEIHLQPKELLATFHYEGEARGLFTELASAYGITAEFDDSLAARTVRFYVDNVDFFTALNLACRVSKTMWTALDAHQLLLAANTPENHKQFDRMSLARFTLPGTAQQQGTELVNALPMFAEFQKMTSGQNGGFEVRAPRPCWRRAPSCFASGPPIPPRYHSMFRSTRSVTTSLAKSVCTFRIRSICTTFRLQPWRRWADRASRRSSTS